MFKRIAYISITIISLIILIIKFNLINKGIVIDDEAWFLLLMRDLPSGGDAPTQFYKLFQNVFNGDIYAMRLSYIFFEIFTYSIFSWGIYSFYKTKLQLKLVHFFVIISVTIIGNAIFSLPICNIPYYANLNKTLLPLAIGLFLLSIKQFKQKKNYYLFLFLSGLSIGFHPFIMITTVTIYPLFYFLIYYYLGKKNLKAYFFFNLGIFSSILIYFSFIESPFHFINEEILPNITAYSTSNYKEKHGILPIIRWIFVTLKYLLFECLLLALGILSFNYLKPKMSNSQKKLSYFILILASCIFYYFDVIKGEHEYASMNLFIAIFLYLIIDQTLLKKEFLSSTPIIVTILTLPFLLSIGTDVDFKIRATDYIGTYFPLIFILGYTYKERFISLFSSIILFYFINYLSMNYRTNWGHFKYADQKNNVKELGINQNLLLDDINFTNAKQLKPYLSKNEKVIVSHKNLNATIYLLEVKMISYDFKLNHVKVINKINKSFNQDTLKLVETSYFPFEASFINDIDQLTNYRLVKQNNVGIYSIYYFTK